MKEFKVIKEMLPKLSLDYVSMNLFFETIERIINKYKDAILNHHNKDYLEVCGFRGFKRKDNQEFIELVIGYNEIYSGYCLRTTCYNVEIPLEYIIDENLLKEKRRIIKEEERKRKEIEKRNKELDKKYGYSKWKTIDDALTTTDVIEGFADTIEDAKRTLNEELNKED